MLLFAYAGNMNIDEFAQKAPSARKIANAFLPGYCLTFNKAGDDLSAKANVMPSLLPTLAVWGILIELDDEHKNLFFDADAATNDLELLPVTCTDTNDKQYEAMVFSAKPHAVRPELLPYDWYLERIVKLAALHGLPPAYIHSLNATVTKPDPDLKRSARRRVKTTDIK